MFSLIRLIVVALFHLLAGLGNLIKALMPEAQNSSSKTKGQPEQAPLVVKYRAPVSKAELKRRQEEAARKATEGGGQPSAKPAQTATPTPKKKATEDGAYDLAE